MKRFLMSKLTQTLAAFVMIAIAIVVPLSGNIKHSFADSGFNIVSSPSPSTTHNQLAAVTSYDATHAWAVGSYEDSNFNNHTLIEHSTDGGQTWTEDTDSYTGNGTLDAIDGDPISGAAWVVGVDASENILSLQLVNGHFSQKPNVSQNLPMSSFSSVSERNSSDVWAVGGTDHGDTFSPFTMHYDGSSWTAYSSPIPDQSPQNNGAPLFGVTTVGANNAWAVGTTDISGVGYLIHWNGTSWGSPITLSVGDSSSLTAVVADSSDNIWTSGYYFSSGQSHPLIRYTTDAGANWTTVSVESPVSTDLFPSSLAIDKVTGKMWTVGNQRYTGTNLSNTLIEQYVPSVTPTPSPSPTLSPSPSASPTPLGGTWISPGNNFTITGNSLHFAAHAYGGAGVDHVNFTAWWSGVNPKIWAIACTVTSPTPGTTDKYECDWTSSATLPNNPLRMNLAGVPRGPIIVSFDVYDKAGSILAPYGTRQGTMQTGWGQAFSYPIGVPDKSGLRQATGWSIITGQGFNQPNNFYGVCQTQKQSDGSADCYHTGEDWQKEVNGVRRGDVTAGKNVYPIAPGRLTWIHTGGYPNSRGYPGDVILLEHQTPRGLVYSMYAHVLPSADLLTAFNQGQHPYISNIKIPIATIIPWPDDITNSHLHFEIRGFFKDNDIINNGGVFDCGCEVGPGYWLWSRGGPEAKGWLPPSLVITDSRS